MMEITPDIFLFAVIAITTPFVVLALFVSFDRLKRPCKYVNRFGKQEQP